MRIGRSLALAVTVAAVLTQGAASAASPTGDWPGFGRTADNSRRSPLTQITASNVGQLERVYQVDFQKLDPDVRRGQQSYPLAIGGRLYVTTNDDNVFALDGASGRVLWQYKPANSGFFKNFGIVANRGLAYCAGRLFLAQLDMKLVALRPSDGKVIAQTAISQDVPDAGANYGYSETSAPICAKNRILIGAAGSEYGIRGFVMAYTPALKPAWPNAFWTIPPELQSWRSRSRVVGGGAVWTPVTVDTRTNTVFFGTGSATPLYLPQLRPGPTPRTDSLIAVDLVTGRLRWWQQLISDNQWAYDVAQPPLVYSANVGGRSQRIVSVGTMEGVWFAFNARSGRPLYERVKVIDHIEHPPLREGQPVAVFPSSLGGLNYSPAAYDPVTHYVFNAAAETGALMIQQHLTPTEKRRKYLLGDVVLGLQNGDFGSVLPSWHDHGSISAIDVTTGKRVWKFDTPEPERGGVTVTASGLGFAGGGDGLLRAFSLRSGKILYTYDTTRPIASAPTIFSAGGTEYVAVTVGGTPTSSGGGIASWLMVFALPHRTPSATAAPQVLAAPRSPSTGAGRPAAVAAHRATPSPRIIVRDLPADVRAWNASATNETRVSGRILLGRRPVVGAKVVVDRFTLPGVTDRAGVFRAWVDSTLVARHLIRVHATRGTRVGGRSLTAAQARAVDGASGGISVGYRIVSATARRLANGRVVVTGRVLRSDGHPAPLVALLSYRLRGRITDASGTPVAGATVTTRTTDRDFWTFSVPSNADGRFTSFFSASDEQGADPVPLSVQVAVGRRSYAAGQTTVSFKRLSSASLDLTLPDSGSSLGLAVPVAEAGAYFRGLLVGVLGPRGVIRPHAAQWPDARGRFRLVLPPLRRGTALRFWESTFTAFAAGAEPGGPVALGSWPTRLSERTPTGFAVVTVR